MDTTAQPLPCTTAISAKLTNMSLLCACLVVFIHVDCELDPFSASWWIRNLWKSGLAQIAVPFFFITSGYLLTGNTAQTPWYGREVKKRLKTLLLPYLLWSILYAAYCISVTLLANIVAHAPLSRNLSFGAVYFGRLFGVALYYLPLLAPLWYVRALILFMLLSPLLLMLLRKKRGLALVFLGVLWTIACFATSWDYKPGEPSAFWITTLSFSGLFYFTLGAFLRTYSICLRLSPILTFLAGMGLFAIKLWAIELNLCWCHYLDCPAIFLTLYAVWQWMPPRILFPKLQTVSFPIYVIHLFFISFCGFCFNTLNLSEAANTLPAYFAIAIAAIAGSILTSLLLQRAFPRLARILFGGRVKGR